MYLGSDAIALTPLIDTISYLEDGEWTVFTREAAEQLPIGAEGALKLKEISYIADGYAADELEHGLIALIDNSASLVVMAPFD